MDALLVFELVVTAALFGLIWTVQLVHYPGFHFVAKDHFREFHRMHTRQITWVVLPLMVSELGLSAYRCCLDPAWPQLLPLVLVVALWASTFFWQVPLHSRLANGKNTSIIQRLVDSNWLRTVLWTLRLGWLGVQVLAGTY
ncbi:MAG: hypothetical protein D6772_10295 [Bacteroidetes bacterium]|nr:MAG: hypothetical protein D6772_10295 [Bacteroidota bacterium]